MTTTLTTTAPLELADILPPCPTDGSSAPALAAVHRAHDLSVQLRDEHKRQKAHLWSLNADLVDALAAGKSQNVNKILGDITVTSLRIAELDAQMEAASVASLRLGFVHRDAAKNDRKLIDHAAEVQRIRNAWNRIDNDSRREFPEDNGERFRKEEAERSGEPFVTVAEKRQAWIAEDRANLKVAVERGRYRA